MYRGKKVAVVMPIHNEQNHVVRAIARVPAFVDLIIAVDDGSRDGTWESLQGITDCRLVRLRHRTNRGVGWATKTGYRYALKGDADLIAVMDGDGQMDGDDLPALLDRAVEGVDYVKGNRLAHRATIRRMPLLRYAGNLVLSFLTRRAADYSSSLDAQCGYTVIGRRALGRLPLERMYGRYGFPNEMFFAARQVGLVIESVPVKSIYAGEVSGINPFTAVPTILFLIARRRLRQRWAPMLVVTESEVSPAE